jgi:putative phosphoribosyl transferase
MIFANRADAGRQLAARLCEYAHRPDLLVLGLPRGGVVVAAEVAEVLGARLDVFIVRKIGVPGHAELAMGAIASGGVVIRNDQVLDALGIADETFESVVARGREELARREAAYRADRPPLEIAGHCLIVIDDGMATGSTMQAAVQGVRAGHPERTVVAVPVAARQTCRELRAEVDELVCLATPEPFFGVGQWYDDFHQVTDEEVRRLLRGHERAAAAKGIGD